MHWGATSQDANDTGLVLQMRQAFRLLDTDLTSLFIVDTASTGDALLDEALKEIAAEPERQSSAWWIDTISQRHPDLVDVVLGLAYGVVAWLVVGWALRPRVAPRSQEEVTA